MEAYTSSQFFSRARKDPQERKQEKGSKIDLFLLARQKKKLHITIFFSEMLTRSQCVLGEFGKSLSSPRGLFCIYELFDFPQLIQRSSFFAVLVKNKITEKKT